MSSEQSRASPVHVSGIDDVAVDAVVELLVESVNVT